MYFRLAFMQIKDYYKTLQVTPVATQQDIKKAFRRLALQYHPDKNQGNHLAEALFKEIQEAYEVLSDPKQREEYNYKRWYNRSIGEAFTERPLTPPELLVESSKLKTYVASMNVFQIDYDALSHYIRQLLTDTNIGILHQHESSSSTRQFFHDLLRSTEPLPAAYAGPIFSLLSKLAGTEEAMLRELSNARQQRQRRDLWERYKWLVVVLITVLICWIMYEAGK